VVEADKLQHLAAKAPWSLLTAAEANH